MFLRGYLRSESFPCLFDDTPPVVPPVVPPTPPKTFTQDEVNALFAKEKRAFQDKQTKLMTQLQALESSKSLSDEERSTLTSQIEELRSQTMTAEQLAKQKQEKLQKEWEVKHGHADAQAKAWQARYNDLRIGHEISRSAAETEVLPNSIKFVESVLRPNTRLVEVLDESNKPTGEFVVKVKFTDKDKDGKPVPLDLTVPEVLKKMKELPEEYGNLFKGTAAGGLGANGGAPGKPASIVAMSQEQYMAARKKNPASVGLA